MPTTSSEERNVQRGSGSGKAGRRVPVEKRRSPARRDGSSGALRGFAAMSPKQQREIASRGGRAAHVAGVAHEFSSTEAREAGRKGGAVTSSDRAHMAEIGRIGGLRRGLRRSTVAR